MVMRIEKIEDLIEGGELTRAEEELEQILSLGPSNTSALKLKAELFEDQGRFEDSFSVWAKVIEIDPEDEDATEYFQLYHLEEREHFYFTDQLPNGGNRYITYPRELLRSFLFGLVGAGLFLLLTNLGRVHAPVLIKAPVILGLFAITFLGPWSYIITTYFRMVRFIVMDEDGIELAKRLKTTRIKWSEVDSTSLVHMRVNGQNRLQLVIKSKGEETIELDLTRDKSSIRARSFFIRDLKKYNITINYEQPESKQAA